MVPHYIGDDCLPSRPAGFLSHGLARRVLILAVVLGLEAVVASVLLDSATLSERSGILTGLLHAWGAWIVRGVIGFAALFTTFAFLKYKTALASLSDRVERTPIHRSLFAAHFLAIGVFAVLSAALYGGRLGPLPPDLATAGWALAGAAAIAFAGFALLPWALWMDLLHATGRLWIYASAASVSACLIGAMSRALWEPTTRLTFTLVKFLLTPLVRDMILQPAAMRIGTQRFSAIIAPECSGLEGAGLLLIFGVLFLLLFREEARFPQALLLLPAGVVVLFLLNAVRIAALILIGDAGAREIALGGFHSQAGWIAFNCVALGFSVAARRVRWFSTRAPEPLQETAAEATSAYLLPFLAILAAGMLARATSGTFEWLYSLRFFAAVGVLWQFRHTYAKLERKLELTPPLVGAGVFILWIALDRVTSPAQSGGQMPSALASASPAIRFAWISLRVLTAVAIVPIAEELAFRGFLLRRFISERFDTVSFQAFTWFSLLASSVLFGLMHGQRWLAGTVAGVAYALVASRRGRLTDSIVAHATTNALLAVYVLVFQEWYFW